MKKVVILGGYGDGLVAIQIVKDMFKSGSNIEVIGFLNDSLDVGEEISGLPVLGGTDSWKKLSDDVMFHVCLHKVGQMEVRSTLMESFHIPDERLCSIVHPSAVIADDVILGAGVLIASCVTVQPASAIGKCSTIRAGANVGHDVNIGDYCYLGPNATLCGRSTLDEGAHVGPGSVVVDQIKVGKFSVIGAGSVALRNAEMCSVWMGSPARRVK
ncbi:LbetaH domain-containing protein [Aestuariirhabdus haliotis]|uniref:hypothetical protein n=1 Tax=Aestuariirhabdus haliotis TaxID=2918751 RepID=UPI0020C1858B|nr:hypothetical protein [Aestuariirhabdus haliotis]MCL6419717.1 hypothetical protein [Aestuariirhabdus haliotis]